ncbi:MAG: hypothetical protein ACRCZ0_10415 [Cetobacterium sp.]
MKLIEVQQFNKQLDDDIYRLEHQLEMTRELKKYIMIRLLASTPAFEIL